MDNLRLILILIGLGVLAVIWLLHRTEGSSRRPGASRREDSRREPYIGASGEEGGAVDVSASQDDDVGEPRQKVLLDPGDAGPAPDAGNDPAISPRAESGKSASPGAGPATGPELPPERELREAETVGAPAAEDAVAAGQAAPDTPKIVTLYVRARDERQISGLSLLDAAIKAGLRFGEMKIFHRRHRGATKPVFSMANIKRPGSFDPSGWNLFQTPGVTLFMTLPGPVSALDAWDAMLATGTRLSELLDADLMDDAQCLLTRQRIAKIREEMREFDRRNGLQP